MKPVLFILLAFIVAGCNNKPKDNSTEIAVDTVISDSSTNTQPNISTSLIKIGNYFFNTRRGEIQPANFLYFLDEQNCILLGETCTYEFEEESQVLIVYTKNDSKELYKLFSGSKAQEIFSKIGADMEVLNNVYELSSNLNNPSYVFFRMVEDAPHHIDVDYSFDRIFVFKDLSHDNGLFSGRINTSLNNKISDLKSSFERFQTSILPLENKMDVIKDVGKNSVNSVLNGKVDYTYEDLITMWQNITSSATQLEKQINGYRQNYDVRDMKDPYIYQKIQDGFDKLSSLNSGKAGLETILDGEILPLLNQ